MKNEKHRISAKDVDGMTPDEIRAYGIAGMARGEMTRDEYMALYEICCAKEKAERIASGGKRTAESA